MKVSLNWLRDYVDITLSPEDLAERLTLSGSKVEGITYLGAQWREILVGRIARLEPHPDPEVTLQLATVTLGDKGEQTVVTGAFNISVGDKVPYAGLGVTLPNGTTLKPRKLRGVMSEGMVLADDELGLGDDHAGIRILAPNAPEGRSLSEVLGDAILEFEITSNRPDCLSVIGLAREIAAITGAELRPPSLLVHEEGSPASDFVAIAVQDHELCPRFSARVINGVKAGPSPDWLVSRLQASGVRSINNLVDITNFVMLEYGQPMHAYDLERLQGRKLLVRRARAGEVLTTLDGEKRTLSTEMLVIADGRDEAIGIAGVMGGASTELSDDTRAVVLEVATWQGGNIRRTSTALGLRTEASSRYEKGLPPYLTPEAADRASSLIVELAGGTIAPGLIDKASTTSFHSAGEVQFPVAEARRLLGMEISTSEVIASLQPLGFKVTSGPGHSDTDVLDITLPPWRQDVVESADIVEEIARIYGYDRVPESRLRGRVQSAELEKGFYWWRRLRTFLLSCGLSEACTYSLVGDRSLVRLRTPGSDASGPLSPEEVAALVPNAAAITGGDATFGLLRLQNPLAPEREILRPTLVPGLLESVSINLRAGYPSVALFELGRTYFPRTPQEVDLTRTPALERRTLSLALAGGREASTWDSSPGALNFFDAKGILEEMLAFCGIEHYTVEPSTHPALHPGRCGRLLLTDRRGRVSTELAVFGEVHPTIADRFDLNERTIVGELDLDALASQSSVERTFEELSRFPAVHRDLAVVVDLLVPAADILRAVRQGGGKLLRAVRIFDIYVGEQVGADRKSVALTLDFQSHEKTLGDSEVDSVIEHVRRRLQDTVGAAFRGPA